MLQRFLKPLFTGDSAEDAKTLALASVDVLVFLFEIFMIVALTEGAMLFLFGGPTAVLRDSFNPLDIGLFIAFVLTSLKFVHSSVMHLQRRYRSDLANNHHESGFSQKGLQPLVDFFFLLFQAVVLYLLSHTFADINQTYTQGHTPADVTQAHMKFFGFFAIFFGIDVLWSLLIWSLDQDNWKKEKTSPKLLWYAQTTIEVLLTIFKKEKTSPELLRFAGLNGTVLLLGTLVLLVTSSFQFDTWLPWLLLGILLLRDLLDYIWSYRLLFPVYQKPEFTGAKQMAPSRPQPAPGDAVLIASRTGEARDGAEENRERRS